MKIERRDANGLPYLICRREARSAANRPVVVYPAAAMTKERASALPFVGLLVECGYLLLIPELPMHGERVTQKAYDPEHDRLLVACQVAAELPGLLDQCISPTEPAAVIGGSLGGLCAAAAAVQDARIRVLAGYLSFWSWARLKAHLSLEAQARVAGWDPGCHPERLADRRTLWLVGEADGWARPDRVWEGAAHLTRLAAQSGGEFSYQIMAKCSHRLTPAMARKITQWIVDKYPL